MAKLTIKMEGLEPLQQFLAKAQDPAPIKAVVKQNGAELQHKMQSRADFKKGYATGTTKRSIHLELEDDGMTAEVGPETEYSPYLEKGTRFMEAQPFIEPALNEQAPQFREDLRRLCK